MKRLWLVMLSLTLVLAFSTQAFAVDVKFSGSFYAAGMYLDKTSLRNTADGSDNVSTAFYYQRLRVQTDFIVSPGLSLITRIDAMERAWGAPRSTAATALDSQSAGTTAENENIAFDWVYINYESPIGTFRAGYMNDSAWGTAFMDSSLPRGKVAWSNTTGPWYYTLQIVKLTDNSYTAKNPTITTTDADSDKYVAAVRYTWKNGQAGILGGIGRDASPRPASKYSTLFYTLQPYAIAQIGPVKVQAEIDYFWGNLKRMEDGTTDTKLDDLAFFVDVLGDFGMFYAGATIAYISGDDPNTTDKTEGLKGLVDGGRDWNPCLIMFNYDRTYWSGSLTGYDSTNLDGAMFNAWFGQIRGGIRPIAALDIMASISYATADKKPAGVINSTYGYELDITSTYKITNNLSYMMGLGYLFTGDYFKGANNANAVRDNYMLINKLTLTF